MLTRLTEVIISQYIQIGNHQVVYLELYPCQVAQWLKNSPASAEGVGSIPSLGRSPGEGNGNALQYSCLENPMDRGAWWGTVHGVAKNQT